MSLQGHCKDTQFNTIAKTIQTAKTIQHTIECNDRICPLSGLSLGNHSK